MRAAFGLVCVAIAAGLSPTLAADTYPRQPGIDVEHYVFRLSLMPGAREEIAGEATVGLRVIRPNVRQVMLDLVTASGGKGMTVSAVTSGNEALAFTHDADRLTVRFDAPLPAGTNAMFTVRYRGVPAAGLRFLTNLHGEPTIFSQNWPDGARHWLPTVDHPYDKATGELIVTTGSQYQVVANGVLVREVDLDDGLRETHWRQSVPIATWLYALGVARFSTHHAGLVGGVPLQTWVFPRDDAAGRRLFEPVTRRAMAFFGERIGPYPYEKIANVQAAGVSGGMEHATAIFYGEQDVATGRAPVVHEVAHQWFGNSVTGNDWDDVWLSEGFATYFDLLFTEHAEGRDAFVRRVAASRTQVLQLAAKRPDTPIIHRNLADMRVVLNGLVYQKGAWTLHMLRYYIGDTAFWQGIRDYYTRFRDRNASTGDLRAVMEDAADLSLQWFFDQWLRRGGVPRLEGEWRYDAVSRQVEITVRQTQAAAAFRLSFELGVTGVDGQMLRRRVTMERTRERYTIPFASAPAEVVLDPGVWLLYEPGPFTRATAGA